MTLLFALLSVARAADHDADGRDDKDDYCPTDAEDLDGFQDEDGCPDPDNDGDGVPDTEDRCPNDPGPDLGCPDVHPGGRVITVPNVDPAPMPMLHFARGDRHISADQAAALDAVAQLIASHPGIQVSVEGHADDPGSEDHNQQLSEERARMVAAALVVRGIDSGRLVVVGYGRTRPIDSSKTASGAEHNRRVEFRALPAS